MASVQLPPHCSRSASVSHWSHEGMTLTSEADTVAGGGVSGVGRERPCQARLACLSQEGASLCVIGYPMRCE